MRLPHALGEPCAERTLTEDRVHAVAQRSDLRDRVTTRDADKDRLVVTAGEKLDLTAPHEVREVANDVGTVPLEPVEQRSGEMQARLHLGVSVKGGNQRRVGALCYL